jgi:hypothetical protein
METERMCIYSCRYIDSIFQGKCGILANNDLVFKEREHHHVSITSPHGWSYNFKRCAQHTNSLPQTLQHQPSGEAPAPQKQKQRVATQQQRMQQHCDLAYSVTLHGIAKKHVTTISRGITVKDALSWRNVKS